MIPIRSLSLALALTLPAVGLAAREPVARPADDKVTLSGCLVRGESGDGYLLINTPSEPASSSAAGAPIAPGAVGTSGTFANIFYWLSDDGDLREHVGHRVQVAGEQKGDVKDGELKIDRKDQWTEMEIKSDGRSIKARVPNSSVVAGPDPDRKMNVLVRKIDVGSVRMLGAACS